MLRPARPSPRAALAAALALALVAVAPPAARADAPPDPRDVKPPQRPPIESPARVKAPHAPRKPRPPRDLAHALLLAVESADLGALVDAGPEDFKCPGDPACPSPLPRIAAVPHLDLAVIRLDRRGRAVEAANVQLAPDAPKGRIVALDAALAARGTHFRRWSLERREAGAAAPRFTPEDDLVAGRKGRGPDFMSPYPASVFKLLVAFHVARRAAEGALPLDLPVAAGPPGPDGALEVRPLSEWLERMITLSDNVATRAVLRELHARGEVDRLNADLRALGLDTLQVLGTKPEDGSRWAPGDIHAGAMDLARLLWLVEGGRGVRWRTPAGKVVTAKALSDGARALLRRLLADQARHEILSGGTACGAAPAGIPALVPERWIDPATGTEAAVDAAFQRDVRPCNAVAEVEFLHKTGLTWNYAADAGIVESLPGKPFRRYVIALVSSAGSRFLDPERAFSGTHPCRAEGVCAPRRLAAIGAAIDAWIAAAEARAARKRVR